MMLFNGLSYTLITHNPKKSRIDQTQSGERPGLITHNSDKETRVIKHTLDPQIKFRDFWYLHAQNPKHKMEMEKGERILSPELFQSK